MEGQPHIDPAEEPEAPYIVLPENPLARKLRITLTAARGNMEIRQRLKHLLDDPEQFARILEELGPQHAAVRDLVLIATHGE